jgi:hypothetical protein
MDVEKVRRDIIKLRITTNAKLCNYVVPDDATYDLELLDRVEKVVKARRVLCAKLGTDIDVNHCQPDEDGWSTRFEAYIKAKEVEVENCTVLLRWKNAREVVRYEFNLTLPDIEFGIPDVIKDAIKIRTITMPKCYACSRTRYYGNRNAFLCHVRDKHRINNDTYDDALKMLRDMCSC